MDRIHQPHPQPSPRDLAVQRAAQAADAHATNPDSTTLHNLRTTVQAALNTGATWTAIRAARAAAIEPLGDLVSGDALHTNPTARRVRTWMTVDAAERLTAGADQRAAAVTA
ncbi:hypothetical protein [Streptomyces sp. STCH 565 A]|uniref:hypothetical protein n=1 Tax=Streptomyces sp. STCH 565 A TaxID=2950532 RepID=UPI002075861F|nr:hypothetical protein [Streptomyces sp. STCH 565 A]MCM8555373.1 hypothetical protein [Streptomyces sp. STCH 565 A]